jgi:hypothetical protein
VPVAALWANTHITWHLMFLLWGLYLLAPRASRPWRWVALALFATLANPWGWTALARPFEYALFWRNEPIFRAIGELQPLPWSAHLRDGLPLFLALWVALAVWRARWRGFDPVEALGGAFFVFSTVTSQRFLGLLALFAAPFLARDLAEWLSAHPLPHVLGRPLARGALAALACFGVGIAEWTRPELPLGVAIDTSVLPVVACDWIAAHGVRGRALNDMHLGGYLLWRFWPERDRLPFMTTQPEDVPRDDRNAYAAALTDERAWRTLDARCRFDWAMLDRNPSPGERLLAFVGADSSFVPVFMDDAAVVFARRDGPMAALADSFGYRTVPADRTRRDALLDACAGDPTLRARARAEFARQSAASAQNAYAEQALGALALMDGDVVQGRAHLEHALSVRPSLESARRVLSMLPAGRSRRR